MSRIIGFPRAFTKIVNRVLQINEGGTAGNSPDAAANNLGVLKIKDLDRAQKASKLINGEVNPSQLPDCVVMFPTVEVPVVHVNEKVVLTITNYTNDMFVYNHIGDHDGSFYQIEDKIYFTAPSTPGKARLKIKQLTAEQTSYGERVIEIDVLEPKVLKPSITYPSAGQSELSPNLAITATDIQTSFGAINYSKTEWQISLTADFTSIVSLNNSVEPKYNSLMPGSLTLGGSYYVRVRYLDSSLGYSDWSDSVFFSIKNNTILKSADAKFNDITNYLSDGVAGAFGSGTCISADGNVICIGAPKRATSGVWFFVKNSQGIWGLPHNAFQSSGEFGSDIAASSDASRVIIGRPLTASGALTNAGSALIYQRLDNKWIFETEIFDPFPCANGKFGQKVSISSDGSIIAISASRSGTDTADYGYVFIYKGQNEQYNTSNQINTYTWVFEAKLAPSTGVTTGYGYGSALALNSAGTILYVGAPGATVNSLTSAGAVYRYDCKLGTWSETYKITAPSPAASESFGTSLSITPGTETQLYGDTVCCIGAPGKDSNKGKCYFFKGNFYITGFTASDGVAGDLFGCSVSLNATAKTLYCGAYGVNTYAGAVYRFDYSAGTWTQTAKILAEDSAANYKFGSKVILSGTEDRVIITSPNATVGGIASAGCVHSYV